MKKILVMDRGFVLIGDVTELDDPLWYRLDNCGMIRRWGTTKGLGELAEKGPLDSTVIDSEPDGVLVNRRHVFREIPCSWK